jgi:hypothetical protein
MIRFIDWNARIYAAVLPLYPQELRRDFGAEMIEVFVEDLAEAWRNAGLAGAIGVWCRAAWEIVRIAIPRQLENPAVGVPFLSFVQSVVALTAEMVLSHGRLSAVVVLLPGLISALTSIAAVRVGKLGLPAPLEL